ncbi:ribosome silencing factor [Geodermatophilus sp. SYSU D01180]
MTASAEARETALLAAQAAADKLATDVSIVDVSDRLAITDAFVLAAAPNERQVQAIVDEVEERLRRHGVKPVRREGVAEARWVLLDFVDVVVHVQHAEERAYYALERLWKDCPTIPFVDRAAPQAADGAAGTPSPGDTGPGSPDPVPLAPDPTEDLTEDDLTDDQLTDEDALEGDPLQEDAVGGTADGDAGTTGR